MGSGVGHLLDANTTALWRLEPEGLACAERPDAQFNVPNTVSWMERTITLTTAGQVTFSYFVHGQSSFDLLQVLVDGVVKKTYSGGPAAGSDSITVGGGTFTLRFQYVKNATTDTGEDTARITSLSVHDPGIGDWSYSFETPDAGWSFGGYGGGWVFGRSPGTYNDVNGNNQLVGYSGATSGVPGIGNNAARFIGASVSGTASDPVIAAVQGDWSVEFWFKRLAGLGGSYQGLFGINNGNSGAEMLGIYAYSYKLHCQWYAAPSWPSVTSSQVFDVDRWYHCAVTGSRTQDAKYIVTLYIDAVQVGQATMAAPGLASGLIVTLGRGHSNTYVVAGGLLDDVKFSNVVRSADEILADYMRPEVEDAGSLLVRFTCWSPTINRLYVDFNQMISPASVQSASLTWGGGQILARSLTPDFKGVYLDVEVADPSATYQLSMDGFEDFFGRAMPSTQATAVPQAFPPDLGRNQLVTIPLQLGNPLQTLLGGASRMGDAVESGSSTPTEGSKSGGYFNAGFN